jgi:hypothetical protein
VKNGTGICTFQQQHGNALSLRWASPHILYLSSQTEAEIESREANSAP